jgi:hypothetical protein
MLEEIQRLKSMGFGKKAVARMLAVSRNTIKKYWEAETVVVGEAGPEAASVVFYQAPWSDRIVWDDVRKAVDRGQALAHYWELYQEGVSREDPLLKVPYVSFWREYKRRCPTIPLEFGRVHPPGACCEADYKGSRPGFGYTDPVTGVFVVCELFGAVLGFSQYLSVDVTLTQRKADFLRSIDGAYRDYGGVPKISVTDNLKSAVEKATRYDPDLNPDYSKFCAHYGTVAIPARPRKPKDKNLIEGALKLFWRWFSHALPGKRFTSLEELRVFTRGWADRFNGRVQRRYGQSRKQRLEEERGLLGPVPADPYEICEWKKAKPHPDCHIQVKKNYYSVPFQYRGKSLDVRITARAVEVFHNQSRIVTHTLLPENQQGKYSSHPGHLPPAHAALLETLPRTLQEQARNVGPQTGALVEKLFALGNHPLRYLRRVQGLMGLLRQASSDEVEGAIQTCRILGEDLPRAATLLSVIAGSRASPSENQAKAINRQPNRYLRSATEKTSSLPETQETA